MKKITLFICLLISLTTFAQNQRWKSMSDFHSVISHTFHPAEENNLQPVKDSAELLVKKAKLWQSSTIPAGFDVAKLKPVLKQLVRDCEAVQAGVRKEKTDAELKALITKAHDTYHKIVEECNDQLW